MVIPESIIERIKNLPIESVAEKLGIHVNKHKAICFMHDDKHPSLSFNSRKNIYFCFVCNKGGDPIKLVQDFNGWSFQEASAWLAEEYAIWHPAIQQQYRKRPQAKRYSSKDSTEGCAQSKEIDVEIGGWIVEHSRLSSVAKSFLFDTRHYKPEIVESLKIGSLSYPSKLSDRLLAEFGEDRCRKSGFFKQYGSTWRLCFSAPGLLFPYYRSDGVLYSIQARYFEGKQRFAFPPGVRQRLFNAQILNEVSVNEPLYVSEGVTDCIALLSAGKRAVAFPSGSICHKEDIRLLSNKRLFMYPDQDKAGEGLYVKLNEGLRPFGNKVNRCELPNGFKDYSDYYVTL